jgi:hypothetical protein
MSYSLTPILVDLRRIQSLMGSKDVALLRAVIKKHRKDMLDTDALGDDFEDFEADIKAEYKAFVAGDFSGVELNASSPEAEEDEDEEEADPALAEEFKNLDAADPKAVEKFILKHDLLKDLLDDEEEEDDEEEDDEEVVREVTTGAALAQLVLGGKPDRRYGYKYGYALQSLCEHLGEVPDHDSWCTIRDAALRTVDGVLKKAGAKPKTFSTSEFLVNRGAPIAIPKPADFPFIGYLTREEVRKLLGTLDTARIEAAIRDEKGNEDWLRAAVGELRAWLEACAKTDRDLICFYA